MKESSSMTEKETVTEEAEVKVEVAKVGLVKGFLIATVVAAVMIATESEYLGNVKETQQNDVKEEEVKEDVKVKVEVWAEECRRMSTPRWYQHRARRYYDDGSWVSLYE